MQSGAARATVGVVQLHPPEPSTCRSERFARTGQETAAAPGDAAIHCPANRPDIDKALELDSPSKIDRLNEAERARRQRRNRKDETMAFELRIMHGNFERRGPWPGSEGFDRTASFRSSRRPFFAPAFRNFAASGKSGAGKTGEGDECLSPPDRALPRRANSALPLRREVRPCENDGEIRKEGPSISSDRTSR